MAEIELSPQQADALERIKHWYESAENAKTPQELVFVLSGYAGTGKTTLVRHAIAQLEVESVEYATYTGKAALVLKKYNNVPARTIHSLIYKYVPPNRKLCADLYEQIRETSDEKKKKQLQSQLDEEQKPKFVLNDESDLRSAELLVLDECSMVNKEMLDDLCSFQVPIIALGDPGQLPPIEGTGALFNLRAQPDALLTEIHRQAEGNPIIEISTRARQRIPLPQGEWGDSYLHLARPIAERQGKLKELCLAADQILCGKNKTRQALNVKMREWLELQEDMSDPYPVPGDKLICLRNDNEKGLFNGLFAEVVDRGAIGDASIRLTLQLENEEEPRAFDCLRAYFDSYYDPQALKDVKWWERKGLAEFEFGYAITVHKSQGSQWGSVLLWDDRFLIWRSAAKERAQWLYTAVTRAAQRLVVLS